MMQQFLLLIVTIIIEFFILWLFIGSGSNIPPLAGMRTRNKCSGAATLPTNLPRYPAVGGVRFIGKNPLRIFFYAALINLFTLPIANYLYQNISNNFLLIELGVFLIEWILIMVLFEMKYYQALLLSFVANFITAAISLLFR
jgi:hypothetical protein